jgi:hypothetical protein
MVIIMGVQGWSERTGVAITGKRHVIHVCFADDTSACIKQTRNHSRVCAWDVSLKNLGATGHLDTAN